MIDISMYSHSCRLTISVQPIADQGWQRRGRKILKILGEKTQFFLNTLYKIEKKQTISEGTQ